MRREFAMSWAGSTAPFLFSDRSHAGKVLANQLQAHANEPDVLVLALPRGGVPVAYEVAKALGSPLDVFQVRKLGVPGEEELAMGALASGGILFLNRGIIESIGITPEQIDAVIQQEQAELERRDRAYRGDRPTPQINGKTVILIDDGLATGSTMRAAAEAIRRQQPKRLIIAVPTGAAETCEQLRAFADEVICAIAPSDFRAVGLWYEDFPQLNDQQVRELLAHATIPENQPNASHSR
ncbi:MAG TPA: phosphoribosyltransferase [Tepidisphaeraceae bacterium]|jgi:putative phosphoribosyl transferase